MGLQLLFTYSLIIFTHLERSVLLGLSRFILLCIFIEHENGFGPIVSFGMSDGLIFMLDKRSFVVVKIILSFSDCFLVMKGDCYRLQRPVHLPLFTS